VRMRRKNDVTRHVSRFDANYLEEERALGLQVAHVLF
jgi:hypothetical protein